MKTIITFSFFFSLILFTSLANSQVRISCPECYVNECQCSIANCSSGTLKIYNTTDCSSLPKYRYNFSTSSLTWNASQIGSYYFRVLCSDENVSNCTNFNVSSLPPTTTTTTSGGGGGDGGGGGGGGQSSTTTRPSTTTTKPATTTTISQSTILSTTTTIPTASNFDYTTVLIGITIVFVVITLAIFWFLKNKKIKQIDQNPPA